MKKVFITLLFSFSLLFSSCDIFGGSVTVTDCGFDNYYSGGGCAVAFKFKNNTQKTLIKEELAIRCYLKYGRPIINPGIYEEPFFYTFDITLGPGASTDVIWQQVSTSVLDFISTWDLPKRRFTFDDGSITTN